MIFYSIPPWSWITKADAPFAELVGDHNTGTLPRNHWILKLHTEPVPQPARFSEIVRILQFDGIHSEGFYEETEIPREFEELDQSHFSLGMTFEYYLRLKLLDPSVYEPVLRSMHDAIYDPRVGNVFLHHCASIYTKNHYDELERFIHDARAVFL